MQLVLGGAGHLAVGVRHDQHARHAEEVRRQHERAQHVVGDAGPGVAQDLHVALVHAEQLQRLDPAVHARDEGEALARAAGETGAGEGRGVGLVAGQDVGEGVGGELRSHREPSEHRTTPAIRGFSATSAAASGRLARHTTGRTSALPQLSGRGGAMTSWRRASCQARPSTWRTCASTASSPSPQRSGTGTACRRRAAARRGRRGSSTPAEARTACSAACAGWGSAVRPRWWASAPSRCSRAASSTARAAAASSRPNAWPLGSSSAVGAKRWPPRWLTSSTSSA